MDVEMTDDVNGEGIKGTLPPPSPVTGCYLLVVIGEPHTEEHKDIILQRIAKGLLSWDVGACQVDLEKELQTITSVAPEGEETRHGERLIQFASENLVTEVLIHPATNTLIQCIKNLLSSFTRHRHIVHSGYTFGGNGSWALQDGTFSLADFSEAFQEIEVQRVLRAYENTISIDIHCSPEGDWTKLSKETFTKNCKLRVNPDDVLTSGSPSINNFLNYVSPYLVPADIENLLESSDVVGNIRFSHPTLYVFPGGQGDAALFGINGFNMLVDGGFARKACFWDFTRHLDRLDAVLVTRLNNSNICGISSVLRRKTNSQVYPQVGHFFCNIQEKKAISPDGDKDKDPLLINLLDEGHEIVLNLRQLNLRPQPCYRDVEPINLYHKVGHGTLDMYVLSPAKDAKEVKEFIHKWNTNDQKMFATRKDPKDFTFPLQNLVSICALLVWQPANPSDTITRLLFPGSTPQHKIFEGLDRLKHLEFMKHPVCSAKTLTPSGSIVGLKSRQTKGSTVLDKIIPPEPKINKINDNKKEKSPPNENKQKIENKANENKNKTIDTNGEVESQTSEKVIKRDSLESEKSETTSETKKTEVNGKSGGTPLIIEEKSDIKKPKDIKLKEIKPKITAKTRSDSSARKPQEKKKPLEKKIESKPSPKKTVDTKVNGVKEPPKPRLINKTGIKSSPTSTPAKSTKDANNRKVVESKNKPATKKEPAKKEPEKKEAPEKKAERKPISRRPKAASPARPTKTSGSPTKKPVTRADKNGVTRAIKLDKEGTTDSSAVSTPSADQDTLKKIDESKLTKTEIEELRAKELADLKEEQEVVKEIEAVFQKDEEKNAVTEQPDLRKIKEMSLEEKTTEPEDEEEEYLIIEKEEVEQYTEDSINEQESAPKGEDEIQKHQRDSEESEKPKKDETKENIPEQVQETKLIETETCKVLEIVPPKEEPEETAAPAPEMVRSKEDSRDKTEEMSKEISVTSPEDKLSSSKKLTDTRDLELEEEEIKEAPGDQNYPVESQPDEKFSATVESGATTAPTLPEDERIPLDEIKEDIADQVIEEKYVKEETKEKEVPIVVLPPKTFEPTPKMSPIVGMKFDANQQHIRDIVKTPDEVADLPVHEEVDIDTYDFPSAFKKDAAKKSEECKPEEKDHKPEEKAEVKPEPKAEENEHKPEEKDQKPSEEKDQKPGEEKDQKPSEEKTKEEAHEKKEVCEAPEKNLVHEVHVETKKEEVHTTVKQDGKSSPALAKEDDKANDIEEHKKSPTPEVHEEKQEAKSSEHLKEGKISPAHLEHEDKNISTPIEHHLKHDEKSDKPKEEFKPHVTEIHEEKTDVQKTDKDDLETEIIVTASTSQPQEAKIIVKNLDEKSDVIKHCETDTNKMTEEKESEVDHEEKTDLQKEEICIKTSATEIASASLNETVISDAKETVPEEKDSGVDQESLPIDVTSIVSELFPDKVSHVLTSTEKQNQQETAEKISKLDLDLKSSEHAEEQKEFDDDYPVPAMRRQVDVVKIVTSVAHVLKSDAPLEETLQEIPVEFAYPFGIKGYTTELRETHITTLDSPVCESHDNKEIDTNKLEDKDESKTVQEEVCHKESTMSFLEKERHYASLDKDEGVTQERKVSDLIKDSNALMESTSKIISSIKSSSVVDESKPNKEEEINDEDKADGIGTVHRMLVTASSEDGGEETVICPDGSITFHKTESSGRSTPEMPASPKSTPREELSGRSTPEHSTPSDKEKSVVEHKIEQVEAHVEAKEKADEEKAEKETKVEEIKSGKATPEPEKETDHKEHKNEHQPKEESTPEITELNDETHDHKEERRDSAKTISESLEGSKPASRVSTPESETAEEKLTKAEINLGHKFDRVADISDKLEEIKKRALASATYIDPDSPEGEDPEYEEFEKFDEPPVDKVHEDIVATKSTEPEVNVKTEVAELDDKTELIVSTGKISPALPDSGKATPEIKDDLVGDRLVAHDGPDSLDSSNHLFEVTSAKYSIGYCSMSPEPAEEIIDSAISSGKTSPDLKDKKEDKSGNSTPDHHHETSTPDHIKEASAKTIPELNIEENITSETHLDAKDKTPSLSGTSTPDIKIHEEKDTAPVESGKASPDLKVTPPESEKTTPDLKPDNTDALSGKTTPDLIIEDVDEKICTHRIPGSPIKTVFSGKSTPDLKHEDKVPSGKATPELKSESPDVKTDVKDSGKATPELKEKSGKSTPEPETVNIISGVTASEISIISGVSSGRSTPEPTSKPLKEDAISEKATPELAAASPKHDEINEKVLSGKATTEPVCASAITTEEPKEKTTELSGKATPEPHVPASPKPGEEPKSAVSGKATPEPVSASPKPVDEHKVESTVLSGKSTPEPHVPASPKAVEEHKEESIVISGKATPEPHMDTSTKPVDEHKTESTVLSGKATPEPPVSASPRPIDEHKEEHTILSGKATPEPPISASPKPVDEHKAESTILSGKATPEPPVSASPRPVDEHKEEHTILSGKATPEPPISASPKPVDEHKAESTILSGKATPEPPASASPKLVDEHKVEPTVLSGKATPEPAASASPKPVDEHKVDPTVSSGKATPEPPVSSSPKPVDGHKVEFAILSGKSTPEPPIPASPKPVEEHKVESTILSGKATPEPPVSSSPKPVDEHKVESTVLSGKSTPEPHVPASPKAVEEHKEESTALSGKSTPEPSVSASPKPVEEHKVECTVLSGKATPEPPVSASPKPVDEHKLESTVLSGKATPEPPISASPKPVDEHKEESTILSGKATPEPHVPASPKPTDEHKEEIKVLSGKATPEPPISASPKPVDEHKVESTILSGKATPEPHVPASPKPTDEHKEEIKVLSGKATPEPSVSASPKPADEHKIEPTVLSGKATPEPPVAASPKPVEEHILESTALSGKATPEPPISASPKPVDEHKVESTVLSGKATPEPPVSESSKPVEEHKVESTVLSGKSTPEPSVSASPKPVEEHKVESIAASGKATPEPPVSASPKPVEEHKVESTALSGKATPEPPVSASPKPLEEHKVESTVLSGKATPEPPVSASPKPVDEHKVESTVLSGKSTPEPPVPASPKAVEEHKEESKNLSGKATPEPPVSASPKPVDEHKLESTVLSGKATPEPSVPASPKNVDEHEKSTVLSGKATPEPEHVDTVKIISGVTASEINIISGVSSGRATPELKEYSGKSSPDLKPCDKPVSGKNTPEPLENKTVLSGKATPDLHKELEQSGKSTPEIAEKPVSGKQTPEKLDKSPTPEPQEIKELERSTPDITEKPISGKATPEPSVLDAIWGTAPQAEEVEEVIAHEETQEDVAHEFESEEASAQEHSAIPIISGVTASELNIITGVTTSYNLNETNLSDKATPEIHSGKQSPEHKDIHEGKLTSDQHIPEIKCDKPSGKSTPDIKSDKEDAHSTRSSPEIPASGKTTPDIKIDGIEVESEKTSPDAEAVHIVTGVTSSDVKIIAGVSCLTQESKQEPEQDKTEKKDKVLEKMESSGSSSSVDTKPMTEVTNLSIAGPSHTTREDSIPSSGQISPLGKDIVQLSTEELHLSGKSTPDIADVERMKEIHEILKHEKHIPGSSTPPTVPVSPIVKESFTLHTQETVIEKKEAVKEKVEHISEKEQTSTETKQSETKHEETTKYVTTIIDGGEITTVTSIKTTELRCPTPGSDDDREGVSSPHSDISSGQMSRVAHPWGQQSSEERQVYSDEDIPDSPLSATSQMAGNFETDYDIAHGTHQIPTHNTSVQDPMSTSLYGALPDEDTAHKTDKFQSECSKSDKRILDEADLDFDKAMMEHRLARGSDLVPDSSTHKYEITTAKFSTRSSEEVYTNGKSEADDLSVGLEDLQMHEISKNGFDTLECSVKSKPSDSPKKVDVMTSSFMQESSSSHETKDTKDPIESWGKPLGLPSPALPPAEISNRPQTTPKKMPPSATLAAKNKYNDERKRSDSPLKYNKKDNKKLTPVYMDLCYVPHHGNSYYSFVDFFKRIRARYYVFSGTEPSKEVYNALLEAKQTWEDKELEVTIIPTYDTDVLGYWVAENEDLLAKCKIDLSPSASRCTINLQDHETSCSAYRLEF